VPPTVLDPFAGIGTVGQTARQLGANSVGIELNPEYAAIARERIFEPPRWWLREHPEAKPPPADVPGQMMMFPEAKEQTDG